MTAQPKVTPLCSFLFQLAHAPLNLLVRRAGMGVVWGLSQPYILPHPTCTDENTLTVMMIQGPSFSTAFSSNKCWNVASFSTISTNLAEDDKISTLWISDGSKTPCKKIIRNAFRSLQDIDSVCEAKLIVLQSQYRYWNNSRQNINLNLTNAKIILTRAVQCIWSNLIQ